MERTENKIASCGRGRDFISVSEDMCLAHLQLDSYGISKSTIRNWGKLNTVADGRLTSRANKRMSKKLVLPIEYFSNKNNTAFVQDMLDYVDENRLAIMSVVFSLGIGLLKRAGIYERRHVAAVLAGYNGVRLIEELVEISLPTDEFDLLGLLYQSYLHEGKKNSIGSYYTPQRIVHAMTGTFDLSNGELFLDPCCGSGAFLLGVSADHPSQLYGVDNDKIAVLIAKINLLLKYRNVDFIPQIYCMDFLMTDSATRHPVFEKRFDYIATNPPWGAMNTHLYDVKSISSKESFSYFFVKAHAQLKEHGTVRFLFPESILNVRTHKDIRTFILDMGKLVGITIYGDLFSGVTTKYIDIECRKNAVKKDVSIYTAAQVRIVDIQTVYETKNLIFNLLSEDDLSIVRTVKNRGQFSLCSSIWALGIVTGDNKGKLFSNCAPGMEKIYTGKEIAPYILHPAKHYLRYDREHLQQVAKEEIYRAPEKLAYKFISNKLVFAYDNSSSLFLNSANILIPEIPTMSIKAVMAFLNSSLFQFMYMKLFGEVKILKGNLMELPFPKITDIENDRLTALVDNVLNGDDSKQDMIENDIFALYDLTSEQIAYIRRTVRGKAD